MHANRHTLRRAACIGGALALSSGLLAGAAPSAFGQAMVVVPPGCGTLSGTLVPAGQLDDHSADVVPLGAVGAPHFISAFAGGQITVLTNLTDIVEGAPIGETICGLDGDDQINGNQGPDVIFGGDGADIIQGQEADDVLSGGPKGDFLFGNDSVNSNPALDDDDELQGGDGRDHLEGGHRNDILEGGEDRDTLEGGPQNDTLRGGRGNDILAGEAGDDILDGQEANDTLDGGVNTDTLTGGGGGSDSRSNGETCNDVIEIPFPNVPPAC